MRSESKDRSELLERMTGTEIYSRLSVAAHVRATAAEARLRDARAAAMAIAVLGDDARALATVAVADAEVVHAIARARHAAAATAASWLAEAAQREAARAAGQAALAAAIAGEAEGVEMRAELALRRRAEALRPAWDEVHRLERGAAIFSGEAPAPSRWAAARAREVAMR